MKKKLFYDNLYLVDLLLSRIYYDYSIKDDLKQAGYLELWNCIEKYDVNSNIKFCSFATKYVLGAIYKEMRNTSLIKTSRKNKINIDYLEEDRICSDYKDLNLINLNVLNKIEKKIIINKIVFNHTNSYLSKNLNQDITKISRLYNNALKKLKETF